MNEANLEVTPVTGLPIPGPHSPVIRVFGDLRLRTAGDLLALSYCSPEWIASVEEPGILRRWHAKTGQPETSVFLSDLETVWAFCPEGKAIVTASDEVSVWDVASGDMITSLMMPSWVTAVAVRRIPALIATGHDDGVVRLWDPAGHRLVREVAGHDRPISAIAFSPDGHQIATAAEDRLICIWDLASGRQLGTLGRHSDHIGSLIWHPGERMLISAAWDRTARVWDTETFEPVMLLNAHADQVIAMALSADGSLLACADSAPSVHLWDMNSFQEVAVLTDFADEVRCLAFSPDGKQLATGGVGGLISLWDPRAGLLLSDAHHPTPKRVHLAVPHGSEQVMCAFGDKTLRTWSIASGESCSRLADGGRVDAFSVSPDGRLLAVGSENNVVLRDARTGEFRSTLNGQHGRIGAIAFAPDSVTLACANADNGTVRLWDVRTAEAVWTIPIAADSCMLEALSFHPRGHLLAVGGIDWLATGGSDGAVCVWDVEKRTSTAIFNRGATALVFHPGGRWLASTSIDRVVHLWDLDSRQLIRCLGDHGDLVNAVAFSPDGRCLVSASDDRMVHVWDVETGDQIAIHCLDTAAKAMAFSSDGRFLFSGNSNSTSYQIDFARLLDECVV